MTGPFRVSELSYVELTIYKQSSGKDVFVNRPSARRRVVRGRLSRFFWSHRKALVWCLLTLIKLLQTIKSN
jgi:hypothetical protein